MQNINRAVSRVVVWIKQRHDIMWLILLGGTSLFFGLVGWVLVWLVNMDVDIVSKAVLFAFTTLLIVWVISRLPSIKEPEKEKEILISLSPSTLEELSDDSITNYIRSKIKETEQETRMSLSLSSLENLWDSSITDYIRTKRKADVIFAIQNTHSEHFVLSKESFMKDLVEWSIEFPLLAFQDGKPLIAKLFMNDAAVAHAREMASKDPVVVGQLKSILKHWIKKEEANILDGEETRLQELLTQLENLGTSNEIGESV